MSGLRLQIEDLPPRYQEQAREQLDNGRRIAEDKLRPPVQRDLKQEKELQTLCENYLNQRGYFRLTWENVQHAVSEDVSLSGWYGHLYECKRNPLMPDLFIFDTCNTKAPLLVEFKISNQYQPSQRELIDIGFWKECRTFEEFENMLRGWEGSE